MFTVSNVSGTWPFRLAHARSFRDRWTGRSRSTRPRRSPSSRLRLRGQNIAGIRPPTAASGLDLASGRGHGDDRQRRDRRRSTPTRATRHDDPYRRASPAGPVQRAQRPEKVQPRRMPTVSQTAAIGHGRRSLLARVTKRNRPLTTCWSRWRPKARRSAYASQSFPRRQAHQTKRRCSSRPVHTAGQGPHTHASTASRWRWSLARPVQPARALVAKPSRSPRHRASSAFS